MTLPKKGKHRPGVLLSTYHACAIAVVAALSFGARFVSLAITAHTGVLDVHHNLLVDTFCSLVECQFHDILHRKHGYRAMTEVWQALKETKKSSG